MEKRRAAAASRVIPPGDSARHIRTAAGATALAPRSWAPYRVAKVAETAFEMPILHILRRLEQGPDHPTSLVFPEGSCLKELMVQVG